MFWNFCIDRPVFTTVIFLVITIFGVYGYNQLPIRQFPDIEVPVVNVSATFPGADPEVIESEVVDPLEEQINTVEGIRELSSTSRLGEGNVTVQFELERDIDVAAQDVRDVVARARRDLPDEVEPPLVRKQDPDASPIMWIALTGDDRWDEVDLNRYTDEHIVERLERIAGVASIRNYGRDYAVRIELDPERMAAHNISPQHLVTRLNEENLEVPAGRLDGATRQFLLKTEGRYAAAEPINDLILSYRDGNPIRLEDVARAYDGVDNPRMSSVLNGEPSSSMGIVRQPDANTVELAERVRAEMEAIGEDLPPGVEYTIPSDDSEFIWENVRDLLMTIVLATIIVMIVIFFFLQSFRGTTITFFAIPASFLSAFAAAHVLGFSLNVMTLLGLILVVGIVIDDAIVVIENCYRHQEQGADRLPAARVGVTEVAFATIANSLSLGAVFIPIAFTAGLIGQFFFEFGLIVSAAIFASTLTALSLTAMLSGQFLTVNNSENGVARGFRRLFDWVTKRYVRLLEGSLSWRWTTVAVGIVMFGIGMAFFFGLEREFVPQGDTEQLMVVFQLPQGARAPLVEEKGGQIRQILEDEPEVDTYLLVTGEAFGPASGINSGLSFVRLTPRESRERHQDEILQDLRREVSGLVGVDVFISAGGPDPLGMAGGAQLEVAIQHPDLAQLDEQQERIVGWMRQQDEFVGPRSDLELSQPEINVDIDRDRAAELGLTLAGIGDTLRLYFGEPDISQVQVGSERFDVITEILGREQGLSPARLRDIYVYSSEGTGVPLANVVSLREQGGASEINRINRARSVTLQSDLPQDVPLGTGLNQLVSHLEDTLPPGFTIHLTGEAQELEDAFFNLTIAAFMALIFIFLVLAAQFESFIHPFTILMTVPLAILGAFLPLWLLDMSFNMFAFIGLILLFGIVTKNGILLVDYAEIMRDRGMNALEAALEGGRIRFRPVVMTAISTIVGLLPVALGFGAGGEARAPMGVVVSVGMFFSTSLTLLVIPVVYTLLDDLQNWILTRFDGGEGSR